MGHHSAAYTLDTYGHLIDAELASPLNLEIELRTRDIASDLDRADPVG
jgi:hypothetical protein